MPTRWLIGLASGSSADGVDAVLLEAEGVGLELRVRLVHALSEPYPPDLRDLLPVSAPAARRRRPATSATCIASSGKLSPTRAVWSPTAPTSAFSVSRRSAAPATPPGTTPKDVSPRRSASACLPLSPNGPASPPSAISAPATLPPADRASPSRRWPITSSFATRPSIACYFTWADWRAFSICPPGDDRSRSEGLRRPRATSFSTP
jgi:hypothetical protein